MQFNAKRLTSLIVAVVVVRILYKIFVIRNLIRALVCIQIHARIIDCLSKPNYVSVLLFATQHSYYICTIQLVQLLSTNEIYIYKQNYKEIYIYKVHLPLISTPHKYYYYNRKNEKKLSEETKKKKNTKSNQYF